MLISLRESRTLGAYELSISDQCINIIPKYVRAITSKCCIKNSQVKVIIKWMLSVNVDNPDVFDN